jgi:hypothetical protein
MTILELLGDIIADLHLLTKEPDVTDSQRLALLEAAAALQKVLDAL